MPSNGSEEVVKVEDIIKSERDYLNTVYLFLSLSDALRDHEIRHEIEHGVKDCSGKKVRPDFLLFSNGEITDVLEHKSSLNLLYGKKVLRDIEDKYSCLEMNDERFNPEIICLVPLSILKILEEIRDDEDIKIYLTGFVINYDVQKITFETHDDFSNNCLREILSSIIPFKHAEYSRYRFIRAEPKYETYTAFEVWTILQSFNDPYISRDRYFEVSFDNVSARALDFFPNWIRNNKQLANERIRRGLEFLKKIDFIEWEGGTSVIKVYYTRGTKVGDLREYFAKKYVALQRKKKGRRKKPKEGELAKLDDFF